MLITPCRAKWKSSMTDRQRFNNQMHYKSIDRCFNMEFGYWNENFDLWPMFKSNNIHTNEEAAQFLNFDRIEFVFCNTWMCPPFETKVLEIKGDKKILINEHGLIAEVPLDQHDTIPHYLESSVKTPEDWKRIKAEKFDVSHPDRVINIKSLEIQHPSERNYPLGIDCGSMIGNIRNMLTFEGIAYAIYDYPAMVEDMVETCCLLIEHALDQILPYIEFDFASGWEDICFKSGPIVSIDFFKDIIVPRYKRISRKLRGHGIDIWFTDCDGDVRPIVPHFLDGGINCLFPLEVNGSGHPVEIAKEYGKELRLMGGFDKMALGAGPLAIKNYMESIAELVVRGGYIPFCDHRCPPNVKQEDYLYYLDLKQQMFG